MKINITIDNLEEANRLAALGFAQQNDRFASDDVTVKIEIPASEPNYSFHSNPSVARLNFINLIRFARSIPKAGMGLAEAKAFVETYQW